MALEVWQAFILPQIFFGTTLLHAHAKYIYIVCVKYQKALVKALLQIDFPVYAPSKHKQNPCLKAHKLSSQSCHFIKNSFFWHQTFHANVQCVYIVCVGKVHKAVILSEINVLAPNFFMQIFNVSILCRQSFRLFQPKLWYKLIGPHMHYLFINKLH